MQDIYKVETHPLALSENMITGDKYRITFLTEGLIRLEYDEPEYYRYMICIAAMFFVSFDFSA